jgi:hypothetical protein
LNAPGGGSSRLGSAVGQRLPVAPRERRPALAALAVLLILGGALTSAYLVMASGQRVAAIRIAQPVAAGQRIPLSALEEVQVGDTGDDYYINWSERAKVAAAYAAVPLVKGALLTNGMVSREDDAARGRVIVGLAVKPGQFPAGGLTVGARVALYAVASETNGGSGGGSGGRVLSGDAIVMDIGHGDTAKFGGGDQTTLDVAVPANEAAKVAQAASAGGVAVALLPEGTKVSTSQGGDPSTGNPAANPNTAPNTGSNGPANPNTKNSGSPTTGGH